MAAKGVREVTGKLIVDDSYFIFEPYPPDWTQDDVAWGYGAPVMALAFHDNALFLRLEPGTRVGQMARVWLDPAPEFYRLVSHVETAPAKADKQLFVYRGGLPDELDVWGQIPIDASDDERVETIAVADPARLVGGLFRKALERREIKVPDSVKVLHATPFELAEHHGKWGSSPTRPLRIVLAEHVSSPLREEIKVTNKVSQNLHAEMLLRTLGRETGRDGSLEGGLEALRDFCSQIGIDRDEIQFADGSGLSRAARATPHAIVQLLQTMAGSQRFAVFFDSLPVAGEDGTLRKRFSHSPAEGRIHAKTGTIEHVCSLSGYMDLPSRERLAFAMIGNSHPLDAHRGAEVLDSLALAIFNWFAHRKP